MRNRDQLMKSARIVVRVSRVTNRLFLLAVVTGLLLSWILSAQFGVLVGRLIPQADLLSAMSGMRWEMALGIIMAVTTDQLLKALSAIIASADAGDPFIAVNSGRLRRIGGCLLALQLCEIPGALIARYYPVLGSAGPSGDVSIAGWISVLMVFVLARVFAAGSAMRDDLEGTV